MITTIQIHENVKKELDRIKENKQQSYEEAILMLMNIVQQYRLKQKSLLIEGYQEMTKESLNIIKEWKNAGTDWD